MSSFTSLHGIDRAALLRVVEPVVHAHGAEVVDIELKSDRAGMVLRVYVEKAGASENNLSTKDAAVNLELCADVSRDLSPALDVVDLIPHAYNLEVSSPGVERPLHGEHDFVRFGGQKAKIKLREPVGGQKVLVGVLDGVEAGTLRVKEGSRVHAAPLTSIESARLVFEFGNDGRQQHKSKHRG